VDVLVRVWRQRMLLTTLIRRQYQLRYRQSFVGIAWALVPVLGILAVGTVIFGRLIDVDTGGTEYPVFAMAPLVPWTLFANSVSTGVPSIVSSLNMVHRLTFPRAVLPMSMVGLSLVDMAVAFVAFVVLAFVTGSGLPITGLWAPLLLIVEIPLIVGVVLLGSALNVFARDIRLAVPFLVQLWLFLTPVLYPLELAPADLRPFFLANPMTGIVESFRGALVLGEAPDLGLLWPSLAGAALLLVIGSWYFGAVERRFSDVI
jgi:lipopolysaccharide transport system permease protein